MKTTRYFQAMRHRPDRATIKLEWIEHALRYPLKEFISEGRSDSPLGINSGDGGTLFASHLATGWWNRAQCILWSVIWAMRIKYFQDTDTLYIEFRQTEVVETKDLDENTILDLDRNGNICGITIEHARERTEIPTFSYEQITA
jgi:uncharacterized protein YuzE